MHVPGAPAAPARRGDARWAVALVAVALPFLLLRLGAKDVWEASEGRPLQSAREMRAVGDYVVQRTNGQDDLTKPPLYAWATRVAFDVFGENEAAGRLPGVLAAVGCLLAVFVLARRVAGPRAGFLAGVALLSTARFAWQARLAELETSLALGVLWAYVALDAALERPAGAARTRAALGGGLALGFAAAVKGPVAFALVVPGFLAHAAATRRLRDVVAPRFLAALLVATALLLAWPVAAVLRDPGAKETLLSYARGDNVGHLRDPVWYLLQYPLYALPWTPLVVVAARMRWARGLEGAAARRARLPLVAGATTLLVQSCLHAKQTHYLVPVVFPAGALLAGLWLDRALADRPGATVRRAVAAAVGAVLLLEAAVLAFVVPARNEEQSSRAFLARVDATVPRGAPLAWSVFGSHSDYLWHLSAERVGTTGVPERVGATDAETADLVAAFLREAPGPRYAIVTGEQADLLVARGAATALARDDAFQRKRRRVALVATPPTSPPGAPR